MNENEGSLNNFQRRRDQKMRAKENDMFDREVLAGLEELGEIVLRQGHVNLSEEEKSENEDYATVDFNDAVSMEGTSNQIGGGDIAPSISQNMNVDLPNLLENQDNIQMKT